MSQWIHRSLFDQSVYEYSFLQKNFESALLINLITVDRYAVQHRVELIHQWEVKGMQFDLVDGDIYEF